MKYEFVGLDVLRFVACLSVLFYHYSFRGAARDGFTTFSVPSIQFISKYGFFGVYLFFIISGFVIACSAAGRTALHFLISRFIRLYPAFIVCMVLSFVVAFLFGRPEFEVTFRQLAANTIIVSPALHQSFVDGVYWSIVCEIIFYSWILIFVYLKLFERKILSIVAAWLCLSFLNEIYFHSTPMAWLLLTKYSGFFAIGVLLYCGRFQGWRLSTSILLFCATGVANIQLLNDIQYHNDYYIGAVFDPRVAVLFCLASLLCIAAIAALEQGRRRPYAVLVAAGITYPLYLFHQDIGYIIFNHSSPTLPPELVLVVVASTMVLCAWVIWRHIETPVQRYLKSVLLPGTRQATMTKQEDNRQSSLAGSLGVSSNINV